MVKGSEETDNRLLNLFESFKSERMNDRKRFYISELKKYIIDKLKGVNTYSDFGGYQALYNLIKSKESEGEVRAIKSSPYNERNPSLKTRWQLNEQSEQKWDSRTIFKLSARLDLQYYLKRPELQTNKLLRKISKVYNFLEQKEEREWASKEERALELFGDEKFFNNKEGKQFLSRSKLSLSDLKAEKYSQMFVYWKKKLSIKRVLILENHSTFIACKRALEDDFSILSLKPDTLIYGSGKHIIKSIRFLEEITDIFEVEIFYAGDLDPSGLFIYHSLRKRYPKYKMKLFTEFYEKMIDRKGKGYPIVKDQNKNLEVLNFVTKEVNISEDMALKIKNLWNNNMRIPQEVITYEVIKNSNK